MWAAWSGALKWSASYPFVTDYNVEQKGYLLLLQRPHEEQESLHRGGTPRKFGWGLWPAAGNPYPISDQNLWFSLPYFRPNPKFHTLFQTILLRYLVCLNI